MAFSKRCTHPDIRSNKIIIYFCPNRFDEDVHHIELDYPRDMSIWRGIGYHIDAALQWKDGRNTS